MAIGKKSKQGVQKLWRPDFRDVQSLPDTKVIRTGFLLNFVAIALTLILLSVFLVREYSLRSMKENVAALEIQVADSTAQNRSILDANKRFKESATVIEEVIDFDRQTLEMTKLIKELAGVIPEGMILSLGEMRYEAKIIGKKEIPPFVVNFKGRVEGTDTATPSQIINQFQEAILAVPELEAKEVSTDLTNFNRNNEFGYFDFTLQLKITSKTGSES